VTLALHLIEGGVGGAKRGIDVGVEFGPADADGDRSVGHDRVPVLFADGGLNPVTERLL
jgi:hypothetical protein